MLTCQVHLFSQKVILFTGKNHCQCMLEVSDHRLLPNLGNSNDSVAAGSANPMSLLSILVLQTDFFHKIWQENQSVADFESNHGSYVDKTSG